MKTFFKYVTGRHLAKYAVAVGMIAGLYSCKREITKPELLSNYEENNFSEIFKSYWGGINTHYLFWDKDQTNWDSIYRAYKPKFDSLDMRNYSDTVLNQCFQYMVDMTKNLQDGQYFTQLWTGGNFRFDDSLYKGY